MGEPKKKKPKVGKPFKPGDPRAVAGGRLGGMMHGKGAAKVLAHLRTRLKKEDLDALTMAQEMRLLGILRRAEAREEARGAGPVVAGSEPGDEEEGKEVGKRLEAALRVAGEREDSAASAGDED